MNVPILKSVRRALPWWFATLGGVVLSFAAFVLARQQEELRAEAEFVRRADTHYAAMQASLTRHLEILRSLQRLMQLSPDVSRNEFRGWARAIVAEQPEIQMLDWCPRVPNRIRADFEDHASRHGPGDFFITEWNHSGNIQRAGERDEYFPILFFEPVRGNEMVRGFDIARGRAAEELAQARDTGLPAASAPMKLMQDIGDQYGIILTLPVYRLGPVPETVERRREAFVGCVRGVFRMRDLFAAAWRVVPVTGVDTLVLDASAINPTNRFVLSDSISARDRTSTPTESSFRSGRFHEARLRVGGRTWTFLFRPVPQWWDSQLSWLPHFILAGGLGATLLIGAYVRVSMRRTEVIESTVAQRTAELQQANCSLGREVAERRRTEQQLRDTQNFLVHAQRIGNVGSWEMETGTNRLSWSEETFRIFGRDPKGFLPTNEAFFDSVHPEDQERVRAASDAALANDTRYEIEHRILRPDGSIAHVHERAEVVRDESNRPVRMVGSVQDVTERHRQEEERKGIERKFREAQKLESLGVLAGGIAHDFNNLLTGILGNACLTRMELPRESPLQSYVEQIELSSQRAADLCRQMLAYSGKGRFTVKRIHLSEMVRETVHLLQLSVSKKAVLQLALADELPAVMGDATQIRQIIMNLVINASDAIGDKSGQITIHTAVLRADRNYLNNLVGAHDLAEGDYVVLEVTDTGCGMSVETQAKIFEPFFTTKFTGRGLGLSAVLGIVRGHQGALKVRSELGRGTTFKLLLPVAPAGSGDTKLEKRVAPKWRGHGTVLVIDDEESVRRVSGKMLMGMGFQVVTANDGIDGLNAYRTCSESVCAVLLDLTMPRMDGEETFRELRKLRPDACVILMSGYSEQEAGARFVGKGLAGFLQKPFTPEELRERLAAFGAGAELVKEVC
jgi:two-component system cell cycle sensor histidine kinase/response regulator CckA